MEYVSSLLFSLCFVFFLLRPLQCDECLFFVGEWEKVVETEKIQIPVWVLVHALFWCLFSFLLAFWLPASENRRHLNGGSVFLLFLFLLHGPSVEKITPQVYFWGMSPCMYECLRWPRCAFLARKLGIASSPSLFICFADGLSPQFQ